MKGDRQVTQILGWVATAVFVGSYFFVRPAALRAMQMVGATLWIVTRRKSPAAAAFWQGVPAVLSRGAAFSVRGAF